MDDLVRAGTVRYIGCSNLLAYRIARANGISATLGLPRFDSVQPRYNLLFRETEREILPFCKEEGIGVIPYNPLAGGMLTGKHSVSTGPTAGTRFTLGGSVSTIYGERYWHEQQFATVERLKGIAAEGGMTLPGIAVAWGAGESGDHGADHRGEPGGAAGRHAAGGGDAAAGGPEGAAGRGDGGVPARGCPAVGVPPTYGVHTFTRSCSADSSIFFRLRSLIAKRPFVVLYEASAEVSKESSVITFGAFLVRHRCLEAIAACEGGCRSSLRSVS